MKIIVFVEKSMKRGKSMKIICFVEKSMKIIVLDEKSMKIIILKRNIHENHHYKKPQKTNEHHHSEEENLWNSSFKKHQWSPSFWRGKPMKIIFFLKIEKSMNIIIFYRKIYEHHHWKKQWKSSFWRGTSMKLIIKEINEHHHFEEENPWKSSFFYRTIYENHHFL